MNFTILYKIMFNKIGLKFFGDLIFGVQFKVQKGKKSSFIVLKTVKIKYEKPGFNFSDLRRNAKTFLTTISNEKKISRIRTG